MYLIGAERKPEIGRSRPGLRANHACSTIRRCGLGARDATLGRQSALDLLTFRDCVAGESPAHRRLPRRDAICRCRAGRGSGRLHGDRRTGARQGREPRGMAPGERLMARSRVGVGPSDKMRALRPPEGLFAYPVILGVVVSRRGTASIFSVLSIPATTLPADLPRRERGCAGGSIAPSCTGSWCLRAGGQQGGPALL